MINTSSAETVVCNENGLHIRPAAMVAKCAAGFNSTVELEANGRKVDARGIFEVLLLAATKGTRVKVTATGDDHLEACNAMVALFRSGFPLQPIPDKLD